VVNLPEAEQTLLRERIRVLFAHAPQILLGGLAAAVILAMILRDRADAAQLQTWLVSAVIINSVRYGLVLKFRRRASTAFDPRLWGWIFALGSGVFGSLWGLGFYLFFKPDPFELILLTLVLSGMVAGSLASLSAFLPAYVLYVVCSVVPYIWRLTQEMTTLYLEIAGFTVLFSVTNLLYGRNAQNILIAAVQLRMEKEALADKLNQQIHATNAARDKAEQANLEKSQLLAATSHDLRQPVHAQALYLEVLRQDLFGRPEAELVERIIEASNALNDMLDSLLEISRIEAGGMLPNVTNFSLEPLLVRLDREFMPQAHGKDLRFRLFPSTAWCRSDPLFVERILRNLITNALRYTQQGGIVVGCRRRGEQLWLQVWDTGIGIPEDQQQNIFREFRQLANPERDRRKGLGLGLAIVDRLCGLLAHPIRIASQPDKGSMFEFAVPAVDPDRVALQENIMAFADLPPGLGVLVLDDDPMVLDAAGRILERLGCRAWCAGTLEDAIALVLGLAKPDVLLVDYRLSGNVTGIDAAHGIYQALGCTVPTAIITGDIALEQLDEIGNSGFPVLHKPLDGARFRALLSSLSRVTEGDFDEP